MLVPLSSAAGVKRLPGLCGVNVNSLDPIGALKEVPLQEHHFAAFSYNASILHNTLAAARSASELLVAL
jgi:hypothetical protein